MDIAKVKQLLQKELNDRKVYQDALDAINGLEGLKQNVDETKSALEKVKKENEIAEMKKAKLMEDLKQIDAMGVKIIEDAKAKAEILVNDGMNKADILIKSATAKSAKIELDIKEKTKKLDDLAKAEAVANAEIAKINAALADAKKRLKDMMG